MIQNEPISNKLKLITNLYTKVIEREHYQSEMSYHFDVLLAIYQNEGTMSQQKLADLLLIDKPHLLSIVYHLSAEGLIDVENNITDRSDNFLFLTQKGMNNIRSINQAAVILNERITAGIEASKLSAFFEVLSALECNLKEEYKVA
ncbi:MarR family winged helix-turn-helix transcriptional regulator [Mucilaginibacter lacusdianchii]|uniref:MarR family winged helix-turn-helix transcriptional regulator n=1 Tax=Mucilaginibacter lacusdianchii TaxID=2684211 RepID=UPI00131E9B75|nr:MarR family winged helix-turn-helix transcriptional regulator [Mucilaginibacter sp. JXJ CY 39]